MVAVQQVDGRVQEQVPHEQEEQEEEQDQEEVFFFNQPLQLLPPLSQGSADLRCSAFHGFARGRSCGQCEQGRGRGRGRGGCKARSMR